MSSFEVFYECRTRSTVSILLIRFLNRSLRARVAKTKREIDILFDFFVVCGWLIVDYGIWAAIPNAPFIDSMTGAKRRVFFKKGMRVFRAFHVNSPRPSTAILRGIRPNANVLHLNCRVNTWDLRHSIHALRTVWRNGKDGWQTMSDLFWNVCTLITNYKRRHDRDRGGNGSAHRGDVNLRHIIIISV